MAKTRSSGNSPSSATHNSSPTTDVVPLSMAPPLTASTTDSQVIVPSVPKIQEPSSMASSSDDKSDDPEVIIEGVTEPTSIPPPQNKRKARTSLRLVGRSTAKKQKKEETEVSTKEKLDGFRKRKFAKGMAMDIPWLVDNGGQRLVALIEKQGWVGLFEEKFYKLIHPNELVEFYCNLSVSESGVCISVEKGEGLEFNAEQLGKILGVPATGYAVHSKRGVPALDYAEIADLVTSYSRGEVTSAVSFHQDALTPFHKLVYNLVRRSIVPRTQKRAKVEVLDVVYMDLLISEREINFPQLMIKHMGYMQKQFSLPYAPLITAILEHFSVPLKSVGQPLSSADVMGEVAFKNLGIEVKDGKLYFTEEKGEEMRDDAGEPTAEEQPQDQPQGETDLLALIREVRREMLAGFDVLYEKMDALEGRSGAVVIQVDRLSREVSTLRESTKASNASLITTLTLNHTAVMRKLEEFEGTTVEEEVEEEEADATQEQPTPSAPAT